MGCLGTNRNFSPKLGFSLSEMEKEEKAFDVGHMISTNRCGTTVAQADVIPSEEFLQEKGVISVRAPGAGETLPGARSSFRLLRLRRDSFVLKREELSGGRIGTRACLPREDSNAWLGQPCEREAKKGCCGFCTQHGEQ